MTVCSFCSSPFHFFSQWLSVSFTKTIRWKWDLLRSSGKLAKSSAHPLRDIRSPLASFLRSGMCFGLVLSSDLCLFFYVPRNRTTFFKKCTENMEWQELSAPAEHFFEKVLTHKTTVPSFWSYFVKILELFMYFLHFPWHLLEMQKKCRPPRPPSTFSKFMNQTSEYLIFSSGIIFIFCHKNASEHFSTFSPFSSVLASFVNRSNAFRVCSQCRFILSGHSRENNPLSSTIILFRRVLFIAHRLLKKRKITHKTHGNYRLIRHITLHTSDRKTQYNKTRHYLNLTGLSDWTISEKIWKHLVNNLDHHIFRMK